MGKRGQITVFIVIGIIIVTVVLITFYMLFGSASEAKRVSLEYSDVEDYVKDHLEDSLSKAIYYCAGMGCDPYIDKLNEKIEENFINNLDFSSFKNVEITFGEIEYIKTIQGEQKITTQIDFPVTVRRDEIVHTIPDFTAEHSFESTGCVPKSKINMPECTAKERIEFKLGKAIFIFEQDQFVGFGECLACN